MTNPIEQDDQYRAAVVTAVQNFLTATRTGSFCLNEALPGKLILAGDPGKLRTLLGMAGPAPMSASELLAHQTAHFQHAAGIPHDRVADRASKEWKLFKAGFDLAARLGTAPAAAAAGLPADEPSDDYKRGWEDGMKEATELLSVIEEPFAWSRRPVITDDQGYAIGLGDPEFEVGAEPPESDGGEGWSPLYFHAAPVAPMPAASEGWTENTGEMPVEENTLVRVMLRDGYEGEDKAGKYRWQIYTKDSIFYSADIIKWRIAPAMEAQSHE